MFLVYKIFDEIVCRLLVICLYGIFSLMEINFKNRKMIM